MNNFTAMIEIEDDQGGGDAYAFDVSWRSEGQVDSTPAPFFDEVRACQDIVRQRFLSQNGRGSYIDFEPFANRQNQGTNPNRGWGRGRNQNNEIIRGNGSARSRNESVGLTYSCVIDARRGQVVSGTYQYYGDSLRTNERTRLR